MTGPSPAGFPFLPYPPPTSSSESLKIPAEQAPRPLHSRELRPPRRHLLPPPPSLRAPRPGTPPLPPAPPNLGPAPPLPSPPGYIGLGRSAQGNAQNRAGGVSVGDAESRGGGPGTAAAFESLNGAPACSRRRRPQGCGAAAAGEVAGGGWRFGAAAAAASAPCPWRRPCLPGDAVTAPRGRSSRPASRPLHSAVRLAQVGEGREGPGRRARAGPRGLGRRAAGLPARGRGGGRRADAVGGGGRCVPGRGGGPPAAGYITTSRQSGSTWRRRGVAGSTPHDFPAGVPPAPFSGAVETLAGLSPAGPAGPWGRSCAGVRSTCSWAWLG